MIMLRIVCFNAYKAIRLWLFRNFHINSERHYIGKNDVVMSTILRYIWIFTFYFIIHLVIFQTAHINISIMSITKNTYMHIIYVNRPFYVFNYLILNYLKKWIFQIRWITFFIWYRCFYNIFLIIYFSKV